MKQKGNNKFTCKGIANPDNRCNLTWIVILVWEIKINRVEDSKDEWTCITSI